MSCLLMVSDNEIHKIWNIIHKPKNRFPLNPSVIMWTSIASSWVIPSARAIPLNSSSRCCVKYGLISASKFLNRHQWSTVAGISKPFPSSLLVLWQGLHACLHQRGPQSYHLGYLGTKRWWTNVSRYVQGPKDLNVGPRGLGIPGYDFERLQRVFIPAKVGYRLLT